MERVHTDSSTALESTYVVPDDVSPDAIAASLAALLRARPSPIVRRSFTVLDTFDGRVERAGARLTRSGVNGTSTIAWQPRGGRSHLTVRPVEPVNFAWDLPDGPLREALTPVVGVRRLMELAQAEEYGAALHVLDRRGKTIARLRIESGRARLPKAGQGWHRLPTVITLTGLRGYGDAYDRLLPVIQSRPGITPCSTGLHGLMLRVIGVPERGDVSWPRVELESTVRADVGARQIHLALLGSLVTNEPGLRDNLDTEFLHDFRVAVRRTRSLLGQIRSVFPPDLTSHFATEFAWLGRLTGPPRDMDVLALSPSGSGTATSVRATWSR
jgi:hypothetical protein